MFLVIILLIQNKYIVDSQVEYYEDDVDGNNGNIK